MIEKRRRTSAINGQTKERRQTKRMSRHSLAWLSSEIIQALACEVIDKSATGVRLALDPSIDLGERLELQLVPQAPARRVRLAWRRGKTIGVEFIDPS